MFIFLVLERYLTYLPYPFPSLVFPLRPHPHLRLGISYFKLPGAHYGLLAFRQIFVENAEDSWTPSIQSQLQGHSECQSSLTPPISNTQPRF